MLKCIQLRVCKLGTHIAVQRRWWEEERCWCRPLNFRTDVGVGFDLKFRGSFEICLQNIGESHYNFSVPRIICRQWSNGHTTTWNILQWNIQLCHPRFFNTEPVRLDTKRVACLHAGLPKFSSKLPGKESDPMVVPKGTIQRAKRRRQHQQQLADDLENKDDATNSTASYWIQKET